MSAEDPELTSVLSRVPADIGAALRPLLDRPLAGADELRATTARFLSEIETEGSSNRVVDVELARRIAERLGSLIDGLGVGATEGRRRLVQAAVLYFVEVKDVDEDTSSPSGFDDDSLLVDLVAEALGRNDLL